MMESMVEMDDKDLAARLEPLVHPAETVKMVSMEPRVLLVKSANEAHPVKKDPQGLLGPTASTVKMGLTVAPVKLEQLAQTVWTERTVEMGAMAKTGRTVETVPQEDQAWPDNAALLAQKVSRGRKAPTALG